MASAPSPARVSDRVEFRIADLFTTDLRAASVITLYLLPELNVRLRPKLFAELRPGSRVVSHSFDMGDWKADSTLVVDARLVFFWVMPANVAGKWDITMAGWQHEIELEQEYQGVKMKTAAAVPLDTFRLRGSSVSFTLRMPDGELMRLRGSVSGDTMSGEFTVAGRADQPLQWTARRRR